MSDVGIQTEAQKNYPFAKFQRIFCSTQTGIGQVNMLRLDLIWSLKTSSW